MNNKVIIQEDHGTHGNSGEFSLPECEVKITELLKQNPKVIKFVFEKEKTGEKAVSNPDQK